MPTGRRSRPSCCGGSSGEGWDASRNVSVICHLASLFGQGVGRAAFSGLQIKPAVQQATLLPPPILLNRIVGMDVRKPVSAYLFDCLYWLSFVVTFLSNQVKIDWKSGEVMLVSGLPFALMALGVAGALWYFASMRRSLIALMIIAAKVPLMALGFYHILPGSVWSNQTWLFINIGPLLLLVGAVGAMMTPTARGWRRREGESLSAVFD